MILFYLLFFVLSSSDCTRPLCGNTVLLKHNRVKGAGMWAGHSYNHSVAETAIEKLDDTYYTRIEHGGKGRK
jgi:hypothetical protein